MNRINERLQEVENEINSTRDKLWDLYEKRKELQTKAIDLKGKYVKYSIFEDDNKTYLYVTGTFKHDDELYVRGYGFRYDFSEYSDSNYTEFDAMMDIVLKYDTHTKSITDELKRFEVITKEEYVRALRDMCDNLFDNVMGFIEKEG